MANHRKYNAKLTSLRNMQRVTKTMKMVAATRLNHAQEARRKATAYMAKLDKLVTHLATTGVEASHPLMQPRAVPRSALVLLITSDRGLCGGFNHRLNKHVAEWLDRKRPDYRRIRMSFCGKDGYLCFKDHVEVRNYFEGSTSAPSFADALVIGAQLVRAFLAGRYDQIYLAYNVFRSPLSQDPTMELLLPLGRERMGTRAPRAETAYLFEPAGSEMLGFLLQKTVNFRIFNALLENAAGEHGARMTAMDRATTNIDTLCETYTLLRNQARQSAITTELVEIISGAEALK